MSGEGVQAGTAEEEAVRERLLARHPGWSAELDWARYWVVRDRPDGVLLARHRDIVIAGEMAEGRRS